MHSLLYTNCMNETIDFNAISVITDMADLFSHEWAEEVMHDKIVSFKRKSKAYAFILYLRGEQAVTHVDYILATIEKDVLSRRAGVLKCGEWSIPGYFVSKKITGYHRCSNSIKLTLGFVPDADMWQRYNNYTYRVHDKAINERGLGYAYGYPYDFLSSMNTQNVYNYSHADADFIMRIYGHVNNPEIIISGHSYKVDTEVMPNEYLVIDSKQKTITKITSNGSKINEFHKRSLDSYIFQKIPSGINTVVGNSECNFDVIIIEERSEPQWI